MRVLIAEDEELARMRLVRALSTWFETVVAVGDGEAAWQAISQQEFHLIVTDWMMPGIDGLTLCRMIRSLKTARYIYIIMITSHDSKDMVVRGLEAGADDYIAKPYAMEELRGRVMVGKRILELEHSLEDKNRLLLSELETSAQTLRDLLPDKERRWGGRLRIDWLYEPSIYIGGDFFNILELTERHVACYLLDVSGHGVSAALSAVSISSLLHSSSAREGFLYTEDGSPAAPALVATRLNERFQCKGPNGFYFTLFYAVIDLETLEMRYLRAGQTCPFIVREQACLTISPGSIPIGFFPEHQYTDNLVTLQVGDTMVIYSDGVNETPGTEDVMFGVERIEQHFSAMEKEDTTGLLQRLASQLRGYSGQDHFEDDVTVLLMSIVR